MTAIDALVLALRTAETPAQLAYARRVLNCPADDTEEEACSRYMSLETADLRANQEHSRNSTPTGLGGVREYYSDVRAIFKELR